VVDIKAKKVDRIAKGITVDARIAPSQEKLFGQSNLLSDPSPDKVLQLAKFKSVVETG
jgi:hypothetical protein